MFSLREYRPPTHRLPDYLPWAALVAPGIVLGKDGTLQTTFAFRGRDLAASGAPEIMAAVARLNNALKRFGSGWAFYVEAQRRRCEPYARGRWHHAHPGPGPSSEPHLSVPARPGRVRAG